jgi:uncharacterized protein involved in type VI secretion and phage assembly
MPASPSRFTRKKPRYFGKYRGTVASNLDPEQIGRILVEAPDVLGAEPSAWATPCVPFAGPHSGFFIVPPIGAQVWIEFEAGDPDRPIWTGGFWANAGEVPQLASAWPQSFVLQTAGQAALLVSDAPSTPSTGGVILKSAGGATIVVNDAGVFISNGKGATIVLTGPTVDINNGALTVDGA